jgi:hypothetical protein
VKIRRVGRSPAITFVALAALIAIGPSLTAAMPLGAATPQKTGAHTVSSLVAHPRATSEVPCRDPRGCPDLIVNENVLHSAHLTTETFSPDDCSVQEGQVGGTGARRLLVFPYQTPNVGPGSLIVGDPLDPANSDVFEFGECHQHFHFKKYAAYRLWEPADYARFQALRAQHPGALSADIITNYGLNPVLGTKKGFCVVDYKPAPNFQGTRDARTYLSCGARAIHGNQGIGVGWADEYISKLDGQWIDVTNVADGDYILDVETNPDQLFQETRYDNNSASTSVKVRH